MVDIATVRFAVQKLTNFIDEEDEISHVVREDMYWIKGKLEWMQTFLKDAQQKQDGDERIRLWVLTIVSIALKVEDILDAFNAQVKGAEPSKRQLLTTSLKKFLCIDGEASLFDMRKEVKVLRGKLLHVTCKQELYGVNYTVNDDDTQGVVVCASLSFRLRELRTSISRANQDPYFVGFCDDVTLLEMQLFSPELRRCVVTISGMGGLGKTSLARKLYNTHYDKYDRYAWVCLSREWDAKDLLERIIKSFKKPTDEEFSMLEKMKDHELNKYLYELLQDCRYLLVIDDMWGDEAWECLRSALPDDKNGSRVIVTTRNDSLTPDQLPDQRHYVHKLRRLHANESWELFCNKAFSKQDGKCPQHMEDIGKEMVAKCDGLPLAVILLGGLLSTKQHIIDEWHAIKTHIWKSVNDDKATLISILFHSIYNDLPQELQACFLYMGLFPEDYEVHSKHLCEAWVAEDLIQHTEGLDLEESAEQCLNELSSRSLIQVVKRNNSLTCNLHDLLRDLAIDKANEVNFFYLHGKSDYSTLSSEPYTSSRLAFQSRFESCVPLALSRQQVVHTLFYSYPMLDNSAALLKLIHTQYPLLRVLDLHGVKIISTEAKSELDIVLGKLVYLKYIRLYQAHIDELPETIGNLLALQTLYVFDSDNLYYEMMLPRDAYKLKQLRHLYGKFVTRKGEILVPPTSLEGLTNLRSLFHIDINGWLNDQASDEFALNAFSKLRSLETLSVTFVSNTRISVEPLFSCKNLVRLILFGKLKNLPIEMHEFLPKLKCLALVNANLVESPMPTIEKLPNLVHVNLFYAIENEVKSVVVRTTGFPMLESLSFIFKDDMTLQVEEGAMPRLVSISVSDSTKFMVPERLRPLVLQVYNMP